MTNRALLGIFLSIFGMLFVLAAWRSAPRIESQLQRAADNVIEVGAYSEINAKVNGRRIRLVGSVPDVSSRDDLLEEIHLIRGISEIEERIVVSLNPMLSIHKSGKKLTISGEVPEYRSRDYLVSYARELFGKRNVTDFSVLRNRNTDLSWPNMVRSVIEASRDFNEVEFQVRDGKVTVIGGESSAADFDASVSELRSRLEDGFTLEVQYDSGQPISSSVCETRVMELATSEAIKFESGTSDISQSAEENLASIARILSSCPDASFLIIGHTDASGNELSNVTLSEQRARKVSEYLVGKGITSSRLTSVGRGSSEPISDNDTAEGKARNRRIEFKLLK